MSEAEFQKEVAEVLVVYEQTIGHAATRTRAMIGEHGAVGALTRLMVSPDLQQGFKVLRDNGQLSLTFEALVVQHKALFGREAIEAAQWRLDNPYQLL